MSCFAERKTRDNENMRRALDESAIFVPYKTRARTQISIFAKPLMRKRSFWGALQNSTKSDCFSRLGQNREKSRFQPRGVAKIKKGAQDSNEKRLFQKKRPRLGPRTGACIECRPVKRLSDLNAGLPPHVASRFGPPFLAPLGKDDGSFNTNSFK